MTFQTALMTIGQYLLLAVGLILLLLIIVLAVAFLLTFFMRLFVDTSLLVVNNRFKHLVRVRFKFLFFEKTLLNVNDFEVDSKTHQEPDDVSVSGDAPVSDSDSVSVSTDTSASDFKKEENQSRKDGERDSSIAHSAEHSTEHTEHTETHSTETHDSSKTERSEDDKEHEKHDFSDFSDFTDFTDLTDLSDLFESYGELRSEIKRFVDLSNPRRFVSDSISAVILTSKSSARFAEDILLQINIEKMNADVVYGLSNPANTALSFGTAHSLKASAYAYLADIEETSKNSGKRKKAAQLGAIIRDDILIVPDLAEKKLEADANLSFSLLIPRAYIPTLRFLLNKKARWIARRYLYTYFIRHTIQTMRAERDQRKADENE